MALLPLVVLQLGAQSTGKSVVRGVVVTDAGAALAGAQLHLFLGSVPLALAESDELGAFTFSGLTASPAWLLVRRLGFRPESLQLTIREEDPLTLSVRLTRLATEIAAVKILGRRDITGPMAGFYMRQHTGSGRFFAYTDIVRRNPASMTDLLRSVPGIRIQGPGPQNSVRIRGSRCAPLVLLDGQALMAGEVDLDAWDPRTFDGIEIYSGPASVPVEFQRNQRMSSSCGTVVLWSRRGEPRAPRRKKGELSPAARIAVLLDEGETFLPGEVERSAAIDSAHFVSPIYPDSLYDAAIGGRVVAEIVVTAAGVALMDTFSAVTATHRSFVEPVRRVLTELRFIPAIRRGTPAQQVLQLPFEFVPDSTARRRR